MANENKVVEAIKSKKGLLAEFKEFISKGNVMNLAVGVIIGAAFQNIVTALTNSFINPLISLITGGAQKDENGNLILVGGQFKINGVAFDYGSFISAVVNFLIMAIILFTIVKAVNKAMELGKKKEEEAAADPEPTKEEVLLTEIRDLLKEKN
ncbi:MAG: large conductance mechanosensitive channel protein MscL [Oscillospiraceae bacterium]|nr:large conductance mechanosensitive channel protein MscL [Oscillospiraceae bacterium]